jgi:polysaccharide biosynthesis/export protein
MARFRHLGGCLARPGAWRSWCTAVAVLPLLLLAGCGTPMGEKRELADDEVAMEEAVFSFQEKSQPQGVFESYRIHPGDLLDVLFQIKTWQERDSFVLAVDHTVSVKFPRSPELNETERVRPDGKVSLPYLGEVYVVGQSIEELTALLKQRYSAVLKSPELYVVVPEFRSAIRELKQDLHTAPRGLSRLVTVRPDGNATFAMLGDVFVAGRTVPEVTEDLNERYQEVLPGLTVDLFVERQEGSLVYVMGQVNNPGAFRILKPTAIFEALALAGSPMDDAKLNSVIVMRRNGDKIVARKLNVGRSLSMRRGGKFFVVQPDDIVYVPRKTIAKLADLARDVQDIIFFRGWGLGLDYDLDRDKDEDETVTEATVDAIIGE